MLLAFPLFGTLDVYIRPAAIANILHPEAKHAWIKGQHSKNDGGEKKILGFVDIIEHLYPNQDYLSPDSCCKRKIIPFLKVAVQGIPGWLGSLAPAFGPGHDPGVPGSSPASGSRHGACFSLLLCLCLSLSLCLS